MIEEFMNICGEVKLEFATQTQGTMSQPRRISTRGNDKGVKEDSKHIIRQQICKSNDNVEQLIIQFIQQEHLKLINCIVETIDLSSAL
jgi:integrator complex subunit 10